MKQHITCLDGIRGFLALWVFWGHVSSAVGFQVPVIENLAMAVDLFMLLSGFIMAWQWEVGLQQGVQRSFSERTSNFWLRRFFRISPLYYTLFFVSIFVFPEWSHARLLIRDAFHPLGMGVPATLPLLTFSNISAHLTYIYGLIPKFAANNALPDWSLSLEMQFYLAFPFLMFLCKSTRILVLSLASVAMCLCAQHVFATHAGVASAIAQFPQPSVLPLKIHIFAAGMALGWLAARPLEKANRLQFWAAFIIPLVIVPHPVALAALAISALILSSAGPVKSVAGFLGTPALRMAGDLSYCVYLVHSIPSSLLLGVATRWPRYVAMSGAARFALAAIVLTPVVYSLAYLAHRFVERPGIELGRRVTGKKANGPGKTRPAQAHA